jgi:hypothetical protein
MIPAMLGVCFTEYANISDLAGRPSCQQMTAPFVGVAVGIISRPVPPIRIVQRSNMLNLQVLSCTLLELATPRALEQLVPPLSCIVIYEISGSWDLRFNAYRRRSVTH